MEQPLHGAGVNPRQGNDDTKGNTTMPLHVESKTQNATEVVDTTKDLFLTIQRILYNETVLCVIIFAL